MSRSSGNTGSLGKALLIVGGIFALVALVALCSPEETPGPGEGGSDEAPERAPEQTTETSPDAPTLEIETAAWQGNEVVAEGVWTGEPEDLATCDLLEGEDRNVSDWWDRDAAAPEFEGEGFTVTYRADESREIRDQPNPELPYFVECVGFGEEESVSAEAEVEGSPATGQY